MFIDQILNVLGDIEEFFWRYVGTPGLIGIGLYLSVKSRFFQIRQFPHIINIFKDFARHVHDDPSARGIAPIHAFFASVGGAIGVGNLIGVCTAVKIGGPGAVFWMWVAALLGMLVKYGEIYLGVKFRVKNNENSYSGGPMVFLRHVPGGAFWSMAATILMCLYGMEIFIFRTVTYTISTGWDISPFIVIPILLFLVIGVGKGGVKIVGKICSYVIPIFLVAYVGMSFWVFLHNISAMPHVLWSIFAHAFTPHAAIGAFTGNAVLVAMSQGVRRACYTGDIGIGYASIMHSETKESIPARQAAMGVVDILLDSFLVCTMSVMLILTTGIWHKDIPEAFMVSEALSQYFPYVNIIWPLFIFLLGYTTLIAFFAAGRKSATLLLPKYGENIYVVTVAIVFLIFSIIGTQDQCFSIMSIVGSMLLMCNLYGLFFLRDQVKFDVQHHHEIK